MEQQPGLSVLVNNDVHGAVSQALAVGEADAIFTVIFRIFIIYN